MIRRTPLEVTEIALPSGAQVRVPTLEETFRVKGFLIVRRNQVRDYLDVVALADRLGPERAAEVLLHIDVYYADQHDGQGRGVASQLARQLADPRPADAETLTELDRYKGLESRWRRWPDVVTACRDLAARMATGESR